MRSLGLTLEDGGRKTLIEPHSFAVSNDPTVIRTAKLILVATKRSANSVVAHTIAANVCRGAVVVAFQNGLHAERELATALESRGVPGPHGMGLLHRSDRWNSAFSGVVGSSDTA